MDWKERRIFLQEATAIEGKKLYHLVSESDIIYCTASNGAVVVVTATNRYSVTRTIQEVYDRLTESFVRVNEEHIININNIETVDGLEIRMAGGTAIHLAQGYNKEFARVVEESFGVL